MNKEANSIICFKPHNFLYRVMNDEKTWVNNSGPPLMPDHVTLFWSVRQAGVLDLLWLVKKPHRANLFIIIKGEGSFSQNTLSALGTGPFLPGR